MLTHARRWPDWIYGTGEEPDVRFSFANERTFLAWIRTALALLAAGVAVDAVDLSMSDRVQTWLSLLMVTLGLVCAGAAWLRWARAERAIRRGEPLPASGTGLVLAVGVLVAAILVLVGL
jgi:putative membrane protein